MWTSVPEDEVSPEGSRELARVFNSTAFCFFLGNRAQGVGPYFFSLPARHDEMHAAHALDGAQQVNAAGKTPPAIAGGFHEVPALEPVFLVARRGVATEVSPIDFKTEQF